MRCGRPVRYCASAICRACEYKGFVEGDDIGKGTVDVVVTEGFAGNIALKSAEGTARQIAGYLRAEMRRTLWTRIGYMFARSAFRALAKKLDPARSNGGVFLGLNGIVIKSHGGADANAFSAAVDIGYDMVRHELMAKIGQALVPEKRVVAEAADATERMQRRWPELHRDIAFRDCGRRLLSAGAGRHQCRTRRAGRHLRRMDCAAHRHPRASYRRRRRVHLASGHQGGAGRACRCRHDAAGHRPDRVRHLDARQHLSGDRGLDPGRARHHVRLRFRPAGGLFGLRLRARDGGRIAARRHGQARAADRGRDLFAHPRLDRPHHLRAVRRRRGRGGD